MSVQVIDRGYDAIISEMQKFNDAYVEVGIRGENGDIAEYAFYNEYGTKRIPERPFMRSAIDNNRESIFRFISQQQKEIGTGRSAIMALDRLGQFGVKLIKNSIVSGGWKRNADSTIARKKSSQPLVDSGDMKGAIDHKVVL